MKFLFNAVLFSIIGSSLAIFNAKNAKENEFPYLVKLQGRFVCGGALISNKYVLTAAHCLMDYTGKIKATLGSIDSWDSHTTKNGTVKFRDYMKTWIHENFTMPSAVFDIGIIELPHDVNFSEGIRPIKISNSTNVDADAANVTISGWGKSNGYSYPYKLKTANLSLMTLEQCREYQPHFIEKLTNDHICAFGTDENGKVISPCDGDSGKF